MQGLGGFQEKSNCLKKKKKKEITHLMTMPQAAGNNTRPFKKSERFSKLCTKS